MQNFRFQRGWGLFLSKKVQKNFLMGLKIWWSWGSRIFFSKSPLSGGFQFFMQNFRFQSGWGLFLSKKATCTPALYSLPTPYTLWRASEASLVVGSEVRVYDSPKLIVGSVGTECTTPPSQLRSEKWVKWSEWSEVSEVIFGSLIFMKLLYVIGGALT